MDTLTTIAPMNRRTGFWFGSLLLLGLLGHLVAAALNRGGPIAYWHHIFGFFAILAVTGAAIFGAGWIFWRGRRDATLIAIGVVQAIMGAVVLYLELIAA